MKIKPFIWKEPDVWNWGEIHHCEFGEYEILIQKFNGVSEDFLPLVVSTCDAQIFFRGSLIEELGSFSSFDAIKHEVEKRVVNSIMNHFEEGEEDEKVS